MCLQRTETVHARVRHVLQPPRVLFYVASYIDIANVRKTCARYVRHLEDLVRQLSSTQRQQQQTETLDDVSHIATNQHNRSSPDVSVSRADVGRINSISTASIAPKQNAGQEVSGVNRHTHNVEFYGRSSSVALLSQVQRSGDGPAIPRDQGEGTDAGAIVSNLHNPAFSPPGNSQETSPSTAPSHYPQCGRFLEGFFGSIHFIHPVIDKTAFLHRCELLWGGKGEATKNPSFVALYYSILSLGALVGVREEDAIDGIGNMQWSRKFFDEARACCSKLGMVTDLDMVQCYFFMVRRYRPLFDIPLLIIVIL